MHYEALFPLLFALVSLLVLALALSTGGALLAAPKYIHIGHPSTHATQMDAARMLCGLLLSVLSSVAMAAGVVAALQFAPPAPHLRYALLALATSLAVAILLAGYPSLLALYALALGLAAAVITFFEARLVLAMALLKIALLAVSELAHLLTYTLLLVCGLCMWFGVWCFAAYGAASGTSDEVFVSTGRVFPLSRCTEYAYSQRLDIRDSSVLCTAATCRACVCDQTLIDGPCTTGRLSLGLYALLLLALVWAAFITSGIAHAFIAGAVAQWCTLPTYTHKRLVARVSLEATLTQSLGAICFGSLLASVLKTAWILVYGAAALLRRGQSTRRGCFSPLSLALDCASWLLSCVDAAYQLLNRYALSYVGMKRLHFVPASIEVGRLMASGGAGPAMGDAALDALLTAMQMGILVVSTTLAIASSARFMHSSGKAAFLALSAAAVSFLCSAVVFKIVAASVSAVLICFIENPHALKVSQPQLYKELVEAWSKAVGGSQAEECKDVESNQPEPLEPLLPSVPNYCIEYD